MNSTGCLGALLREYSIIGGSRSVRVAIVRIDRVYARLCYGYLNLDIKFPANAITLSFYNAHS